MKDMRKYPLNRGPLKTGLVLLMRVLLYHQNQPRERPETHLWPSGLGGALAFPHQLIFNDTMKMEQSVSRQPYHNMPLHNRYQAILWHYFFNMNISK